MDPQGLIESAQSCLEWFKPGAAIMINWTVITALLPPTDWGKEISLYSMNSIKQIYVSNGVYCVIKKRCLLGHILTGEITDLFVFYNFVDFHFLTKSIIYIC